MFINKWLLITFFLNTLFFLSIKGIAAYNLPNLGSATGNTISHVQEQEMGKEFIQMIRQELPLLRDPIVTQYIQHLGKQLVKNSNVPQQPFYFFVVKSSEINAFAGPGGYVGINAGLILTAKTEGELAAVMAHEIAHVSQRHLARMIGEQKNMALANIATLAAAIAVGTQNAEAGTGLASAASAGSIQTEINMTRGFEREADQVGMQTLAHAGYSPNNMPAFFARMEGESKFNDTQNVPEILLTHPLTAARLADAENRSRAFAVAHPLPQNPFFRLIQARLIVDMSNDPESLVARLSSRKNLSIPQQYTYALALAKAHRPQAAHTILQQLMKNSPQESLFKIDDSQILQQLQQPSDALSTAETLYHQTPHDKITLLNYANLLIREKKYQPAVNLLEENKSDFATDPNYLLVLSNAQGKAGKLAEAYETRATIYLLNEQPERALIQLQQALKFANDRYIRARIHYEIQQAERDIKNK